jgi:hypothetical protein
MDDLDRMALEVLLILGAFCLGGLVEHYDNKRKVLPPPRRMTK